MGANVNGSSAEILTKCPVLLLGYLELAPRLSFFAVLDFRKFYEMFLLLIGYEMTRVPNPGQIKAGRLFLLPSTPCPTS